MDRDRWKRIDRILQDALEREPARRGAFLDSACAGGASLRAELDDLIGAHERAGSFMETPAGGNEPAPSPMPPEGDQR